MCVHRKSSPCFEPSFLVRDVARPGQLSRPSRSSKQHSADG